MDLFLFVTANLLLFEQSRLALSYFHESRGLSRTKSALSDVQFAV